MESVNDILNKGNRVINLVDYLALQGKVWTFSEVTTSQMEIHIENTTTDKILIIFAYNVKNNGGQELNFDVYENRLLPTKEDDLLQVNKEHYGPDCPFLIERRTGTPTNAGTVKFAEQISSSQLVKGGTGSTSYMKINPGDTIYWKLTSTDFDVDFNMVVGEVDKDWLT